MEKEQTTAFRKLLDERFGMFVHYGIYSSFEGWYKDKSIPGLGEWIMRNAQIPIAEYEAQGRKHFCPSKDFAKNLVKQAKAAGMRYIVMTSKHHDGFCLFRSAVTEYSTYGFFGRDLCQELSEACKEEGLQMGLYYSHALDWHEKNAAGNYHVPSGYYNQNRNFWDYPDDNIDFEQYLEEKCIPQVRELLTNYGDLKVIWFDYPHDITKEQSTRLRDLVKSIQPDCQINSRIAHGLNDYESLGDNMLPVAPVGVNIECLITLNDSWGYKRDDHNWKNSEETTEVLCRTLASDATLLLNVGPKADGSLTPETIRILEEMGAWVRRNSEAVYGRIKGNPFSMLFDWGYVAAKENKLFLYVKDKTRAQIHVPGILSKVQKVSLLGSEEKVASHMEGTTLVVELQKNDWMIPVYQVVFEETPVFTSKIQQCGPVLPLSVRFAGRVQKDDLYGDPTPLAYMKDEYVAGYGKQGACLNENVQTIFWTSETEVLCWDVVFDMPGDYEAVLVRAEIETDSYKKEVGSGKGRFFLKLEDQIHVIDMEKEKERFRLSKSSALNIRLCHDGGIFNVKEPGKYRIWLMRDGDGENFLITNVDFRRR